MKSARSSRLSVGSWQGVGWIRLRVAIFALSLGAGLLLVLGRAVHLQVVERDWLGEMAKSQYSRTLSLAPHRGEIVDREGATLASSVEVESIFLDPLLLGSSPEERQARLERLARVVELGPEQARRIARRLEEPNNRFVWLRRRVSPQMASRVRRLGFEGVGFVKEAQRFYPHKETAASVLGFVGADGNGLEGIERLFDERLRGQTAHVAALRDARGRALFSEAPIPTEGRKGATVQLTLDRAIQYLAEKALATGIEKNEARAGSAVVLDVRTGEILALASYPGFNPNRAPTRRTREGLRNRAVTDPFEPGSTMKVFLLAGGLERGAFHPAETFDCENGVWQIGRHRVHDSKPYRSLTPARILQVSSNICSGKIAKRLGGEALEEIYRSFGFGRRTGIELPGEAGGVVGPIRGEIGLVTASFGQGPIMATSLQIAAATAALGNGGRLLAPWLVKSVREPDGRVVHEGKVVELGRPISEETARTVLRWMEGVVEEGGTGTLAALERYAVAGKTGTSQKPDPHRRGYGKERIASFAGIVPADDPRLAIVVVLDEPQKDKLGGRAAAPVFRAIAEGALGVLGVPPSRKTPADWERFVALAPAAEALEGFVAEEIEAEPGALRAPSLLGLGAREAIVRAGSAGLVARLDGTGKVLAQDPPAGSRVEPGDEIVLRLGTP